MRWFFLLVVLVGIGGCATTRQVTVGVEYKGTRVNITYQ